LNVRRVPFGSISIEVILGGLSQIKNDRIPQKRARFFLLFHRRLPSLPKKN